ncbi:tautomerase family protein [Chondrinema litorale]|uniref:tautomerase family protein n=1 Tax=Chondrinema litorale TaxID=2994555 RepID=UPI002542791C|nr:tautomerase family protein [Chondrinema litorale]UZR96837.1 tautomerase family protein [Chondrinema litorale]
MPHIQINLLEGKSEEQKQKLTEEIVKIAKEILDYGDDAFSLSIEDFTKDEWKDEVYPNKVMANKDILYKKPGYTM